MSLLYNFSQQEDGSYYFISDQGNDYLIYFSEYNLPDKEGNTHLVYNLGFSRNGQHSSKPYAHKFDRKIRSTMMSILNEFFRTNDHRVMIFFCFGDDGYSKHRKIVFNQWCQDLNPQIEKFNYTINYEHDEVYTSLVIVKDNPLKNLILSAFESFLKEI